MAVIEYDEYKQKLLALEPTLGELEKALGIPKAREELAQLQKETEQEGFWNDLERSQQVSRQVKRLENKIKKHDKLVSEWEDTLTLCEMAQEEDDPSQLEEVTNGYETLEKEISERRLAALLSGEYDANNAILTFHAGAGGTEAQDWTEMLYRMYTRWAERHGYTYQLMDYEAGDEAGIKSATILIEGENAYGYLKSEAYTGWCASAPLTPTPGGRPASPRWRSCRSWTTTARSRSVRRTSKCRPAVPAVQAASTSTRRPPPCA